MAVYTDAATVTVDIGGSGVEAHTHFDSATALVTISASAIECQHSPDFTGEGVAYAQYSTFELEAQYEAVDYGTQYDAVLRYGVFNAQNDC